MNEKIKKMLELCGGEILVKRKNGTSARGAAVVEPLRYKNKLYVEMQPTELGKTDDGCYKYLGPYNLEFSEGDTVSYRGKDFVVQRFEMVCLGEKPMYTWAVLRPYL